VGGGGGVWLGVAGKQLKKYSGSSNSSTKQRKETSEHRRLRGVPARFDSDAEGSAFKSPRKKGLKKGRLPDRLSSGEK